MQSSTSNPVIGEQQLQFLNLELATPGLAMRAKQRTTIHEPGRVVHQPAGKVTRPMLSARSRLKAWMFKSRRVQDGDETEPVD
jgi:hypothetical protein